MVDRLINFAGLYVLKFEIFEMHNYKTINKRKQYNQMYCLFKNKFWVIIFLAVLYENAHSTMT